PVRPHPLRQRAAMCQPPADEFPAGVFGPILIDVAAPGVAERAFDARANLMAADFDLEPSIAAGRATAAFAFAAGRRMSVQIIALRSGRKAPGSDAALHGFTPRRESPRWRRPPCCRSDWRS